MAGLDRRIALDFYAVGSRDNAGRYIPGALTDSVEMWARVIDGGAVDILSGQLLITVSRSVFDVRWRQDIIDHGPQRLVLRYHGDEWNVEQITDYGERRRVIQIAAIAGLES